MSTTKGTGVVLPTGTVTFLLTDVAGSTRLWETEDGPAMQAAIRRHYEILDQAVGSHGGVRPQEQGEGDSIVAAFARPSDALAAAVDAQLALSTEPWPTRAPLRIRMAVHTGEAHLRDESNYAGQAIIRAARLRSLGHGGQVLVSGSTRDLALDEARDRFDLVSLGEHPLRDLGRTEHVWQVVHPDLPGRFDALVSAGPTRHRSLPRPLTPFIGRRREVDELLDLVLAEPLVVATGAGGAGKTRVAIEVGNSASMRFDGGVRWVELAPLGPDGVEAAVRAAFDIGEGSTFALSESVRRAVRGRPTLLVVDNCEHVTEVVGPLVVSMLAACAELHVLATSRVSLGAPGEYPWRVPPLTAPGPSVATVEELASYDAVQLFCDRARRSRPNFDLSEENRDAVGGICRALDGIPLAIELAAARCRIMSPKQIFDGLADALGVLAGGPASVQPRQQTLDASIRWSVDLLSPAEQRLLERLSVFVDGWTLEAAEAVTSDGDLDRYEVLDALDRLVDQNLVSAVDVGGTTRFGTLETVRQFAARSLAERGEADRLRDRHASHVVGWLADLAPMLATPALEARFDEVTAERGNILAAFGRQLELGEVATAIQVLAALFPIASTAAWIPVVDSMADQLDAHASAVPEPLVPHLLWGRAMRAGGRGDVAALIEHVVLTEQAAAAAGDGLLRSQAAVMRLVMMSAGGAGVVDDLMDEWTLAEPLGRPDHTGWIAVCAEHAALLQRGPLGRAAVTARIDAHRVVLGPSPAVLRFTSRSIAAYLVGSARDAVEAGLIAARSPFTNSLSRPSAILATALASLDLGATELPAEVEVLRHRSHVDGSRLDGYCLRVVEAAHALAVDDVATAEAAYAEATELGAGIGMVTFASDLASSLMAAGGTVPGRADRGGDVPVLEASLDRCDAESALRSGALADAAELAHAALRVERARGLRRGASLTLETLARTLVSAGRHAEGMRLLGATAAFRAERSLLRVPALERLARAAESEAARGIGEARAAEALAAGGTLSLDAAVDYASRLRVERSGQRVGWDALTPTEARVAALVAEGLTNARVAAELVMGPETVKTHLSRVFQKVGVSNRRELILAAARRSDASPG